MELTILGTGTSQVTKHRSSASQFLKIADKNILIDCGSGTMIRMDQANIKFEDLDIIFISHFHIDHIADLQSILWALKFPRLTRTKKLIIVGPLGFKKFYNAYIKPIVFSKSFDKFKIILQEITSEISFDKFKVSALYTNHTKESIALKFKENNKTLTITGDTFSIEKLINFSKGSDLLITECSFDNKNKSTDHITPDEAGVLASKANVKKLVLTHLYPPISTEKLRLNQAQKIFNNTILAVDLIKINI